MTNPPVLTLFVMSPKLIYYSLALLFCHSFVFSEERIKLVIDEKLTLEDIFAAGLRPSSVQRSDMADIRVWERKKITLVFGDFNFDVDSEQITIGLYDDNQVKKLRLMTTREMPLSVEEAINKVRELGAGINTDYEDHIKSWQEKCAKRGSMAMKGFGGYDWIEGVEVGGAFLTTIQDLDKYPAVLAFEINWNYLGSGKMNGDRWGIKNTSPAGYDWDMSFKAWSKRTKEGKAGNRETNIPPERRGITMEVDPEVVKEWEANRSSNIPSKKTNDKKSSQPKLSGPGPLK